MRLEERYKVVEPDNIAKGDVVWVRWYHSNPYNYDVQAIPTIVNKVYDDGNILHTRYGYNQEFAFKQDVVAPTPPGWDNYMEHLHVPCRDVELQIARQKMEARDTQMKLQAAKKVLEAAAEQRALTKSAMKASAEIDALSNAIDVETEDNDG